MTRASMLALLRSVDSEPSDHRSDDMQFLLERAIAWLEDLEARQVVLVPDDEDATELAWVLR